MVENNDWQQRVDGSHGSICQENSHKCVYGYQQKIRGEWTLNFVPSSCTCSVITTQVYFTGLVRVMSYSKTSTIGKTVNLSCKQLATIYIYWYDNSLVLKEVCEKIHNGSQRVMAECDKCHIIAGIDHRPLCYWPRNFQMILFSTSTGSS